MLHKLNRPKIRLRSSTSLFDVKLADFLNMIGNHLLKRMAFNSYCLKLVTHSYINYNSSIY